MLEIIPSMIHEYYESLYLVFRGLSRLLGHVLSTGLVTLPGLGCVWGVTSGTQHWATWSNGYQRIFRFTKCIKPKT